VPHLRGYRRILLRSGEVRADEPRVVPGRLPGHGGRRATPVDEEEDWRRTTRVWGIGIWAPSRAAGVLLVTV
jgi:hypothetical protein